MVENEISILRRVKHRNIVELIEEYETPKEIFLVMELVKVRTKLIISTEVLKFNCLKYNTVNPTLDPVLK